MHVGMLFHMCVFLYVWRVCVSMSVCVDGCVCEFMCIYIYICIYVYMNVYMYAYMYVCMYIFIYIYIYIFIYVPSNAKVSTSVYRLRISVAVRVVARCIGFLLPDVMLCYVIEGTYYIKKIYLSVSPPIRFRFRCVVSPRMGWGEFLMVPAAIL